MAVTVSVSVDNFFWLGLALGGGPCSWACSKRDFFGVGGLDGGYRGIDGGGFLGR
jgi:hypothetical protein